MKRSRAFARLHNRVGQQRWIIVSKETGKPVGRTSYPSERLAEGYCGPGEEPKPATVVGTAGPFGDRLLQV